MPPFGLGCHHALQSFPFSTLAGDGTVEPDGAIARFLTILRPARHLKSHPQHEFGAIARIVVVAVE
jgi:hypothetical protein